MGRLEEIKSLVRQRLNDGQDHWANFELQDVSWLIEQLEKAKAVALDSCYCVPEMEEDLCPGCVFLKELNK